MTGNHLESERNTSGKYLTFVVSSERYGLGIQSIQEVIQVPQFTRVPNSPDYIKGVINFKGKIIPIVEFRRLFGIDEIPYNDRMCIIVVDLLRMNTTIPVGFIVDTALEVIEFAKDEIEPAPEFRLQLGASAILGLGRKGETLTILLNAEHLLQEDHKGERAATTEQSTQLITESQDGLLEEVDK